VRITAQLIDATSGAHLWADRFDGSLEDVFDLQDKIASSVAGVIGPALQAAETARSAGRPTRRRNVEEVMRDHHSHESRRALRGPPKPRALLCPDRSRSCVGAATDLIDERCFSAGSGADGGRRRFASRMPHPAEPTPIAGFLAPMSSSVRNPTQSSAWRATSI
jgi:hypothetical protein